MEKFAVKNSIKTKILLLVLSCLFVMTIVLGALSFEFSKKRIVGALSDSSMRVAATIAGIVSTEDISAILAETDKLKESVTISNYEGWSPKPFPGKTYKDYLGLLRKVKLINKIDSPINIYVGDGSHLTAVLTSEPGILTGTLYTMSAEAKEAYETGLPVATGIYRDKDGEWISAYAPGEFLKAGGGRVMVEINYRIDSYIARLKEELGVILSICITGFLSVAFISYYLVTRLVSSIKKLDAAVHDLEMERFDKVIDVKTDDEIGHLAGAFEKMRLAIKKKMDDLRISMGREQKAHLEAIVALTNAIETRDPYTKEHVSRVQEYALLIAKAMRIPHVDVIQLRYSCFLHDIGKIYIEDSLLRKGKLTREDFEEIKKHAERGAKIIDGIQFLSDVKDAVLYHQERYDGSGYPKGLKGKQIPLLARIVSVADAFDAMTSDRPYRSRMNFEDAMDEIERNAGTQFDPDVCAAFLRYRHTIEEMAKKHFKDAG